MTYAAHMFASHLVKTRRKAAGFSARTFAAAIGSSDRMVRRYEAGDIDPPFSIAAQMASALGIPLDSLYVHDGDAIPSGESTPLNDPEPTAALPRHSAVGSR